MIGLLSLVAFASAALARKITMFPLAAAVLGGSTFHIKVESTPCDRYCKDVVLLIAIADCPNDKCFDNVLGTLVYSGPFNPQRSGDSESQTITATAPTGFNGLTQLSLVYYYLFNDVLTKENAKSYMNITL